MGVTGVINGLSACDLLALLFLNSPAYFPVVDTFLLRLISFLNIQYI